MQQVAQAWLVLQITHDPLWLGITAVAQYGPVIFLGLFAGVAADALPKRRVLIWTQTTMMVLASVLAVLVITGRVELWMILGLAFLLGVASAVDMPVRQAFVMELVGREDIGNAVAINSAMVNGSRVVGPAAAGLAIGAFGVGPTFAVNALSFLAVIVGLWLMRDRELHGVTPGSRPTSASAVVRDMTEGLRYVRHTQTVLAAVLILGSVATVGMNFSVLIPAFAADDLASGASGFGFLMAASGVGSLLAAMRLVFGGRPQPFRLRDRRDRARRGVRAAGPHPRVPDRARLDGPDRVRIDLDGRDREHDDPAGGSGSPSRPDHERLYDDLRRVDPDRRADHGRGRVRPWRGGGDRSRGRPDPGHRGCGRGLASWRCVRSPRRTCGGTRAIRRGAYRTTGPALSGPMRCASPRARSFGGPCRRD